MDTSYAFAREVIPEQTIKLQQYRIRVLNLAII